jgi:16S rRNA (guanine527-N7)-methyltransferase
MSEKITPDMAAKAAVQDGWPLSAEQARYVAGYAELVTAWNKKMNLVGPSTAMDVVRRLVVDSWHLARFLDTLPLSQAPLCLDFGAGAGLPGLPLRGFWDRGSYHLVEARAKRSSFLRYATSRLNPADTTVHQSRVEHLPDSLRNADLIVSRAFMPWREFLAVSRDFLAPGGICLVMANEPAPTDFGPGESTHDSACEFGDAGWRLLDAVEYRVLGTPRYFWAFTPVSIPR